ncbi:MAG: hypothetical protein DRM97_01335 [Thermoprotei archaeon]|nr:MAG: hypothetical protein DRM97_01335 [Thermoprotei archaeon]
MISMRIRSLSQRAGKSRKSDGAGYSTVVATSLCLVILTSLFFYFAHSLTYEIFIHHEINYCMTKYLSDYYKSDVRIYDIVVVNQTRIYAYLNNTGNVDIRARDFDKMDLILVYTSTTGEFVVTYLRYDESGLGSNVWYVVESYNDLVSPINPPNGVWNPNESMKVEIKLEKPLNATLSYALVVCTPYGASSILTRGG